MIDLVHDTQKAFRALTNASSFPGTLCSIAKEMEKADLDNSLSKGIQVLGLTLLDREVSFFCPNNKIARSLSRLTYSPAISAGDAQFVICNSGSDAAELIQQASIGDLLDPHKGATIIIETPSLTEGDEMILNGPGIKEEEKVRIKDGYLWLDARNEAISEFPLGVDLYLLDINGNIMILPRTTRIRRKN